MLSSPRLWFWVCVALVGVRLLWPLDIPFIYDEPELIARALALNAQNEWAVHGLQGTRGAAYGPLPLWFYQAALFWTTDLAVVAMGKALVLSLLSLWSVWTLVGVLKPKAVWIAVVPFLSLYLWVYARDLWDNSFLTGFSAVVCAAYLRFIVDKSKRWFALALLACALCLQIHLMCLPWVGAIAMHLLVFRRAWLRANLGFVAGVFAVGAASLYPYLQYLLGTPSAPVRFALRPASFFFALYGGREFSAIAAEYFFGNLWFLQGPWFLQGVGALAVGLTLFAFVPVFYGMWVCAKTRQRELHWFLTLWLVLHVLVIGANQLVSHPYYYNAAWLGFFAFFCIGWEALPASVRWKAAGRLYVGGLAVSFAFGIVQVHWNSGNRELHFGTVLGNLWEVAEQRACFPVETPVDATGIESRFGAGFQTLRHLVRCPSGPQKASQLFLRYARPSDTREGKVVLVPMN